MSRTLHERLISLVTQIHSEEKDAFRLDPQKGKAWKGVPPLFCAPIALHHVVYETISGPTGLVLSLADLEYDDTLLRVGRVAAGSIPDSDPTGRYLLESITDVYARHDHDICLAAFAKLRPHATPLGSGYQERQDRIIASSQEVVRDTNQ